MDALFRKHGYHADLYGHFGQGCLHCRIDFDLQLADGDRIGQSEVCVEVGRADQPGDPCFHPFGTLCFIAHHQHRHAEARCFREPHVPRNDRAIDLVSKVLEQLRRDLLRERVARIVHGAQQSLDLQAGVQVRTHPFDGLHQVAQPRQRIVLALHRDHHRLGGGKPVDSEEVEGRRTVDEHEMVQALMEEIDKFDDEESSSALPSAPSDQLGGFALHRLPILNQP